LVIVKILNVNQKFVNQLWIDNLYDSEATVNFLLTVGADESFQNEYLSEKSSFEIYSDSQSNLYSDSTEVYTEDYWNNEQFNDLLIQESTSTTNKKEEEEKIGHKISTVDVKVKPQKNNIAASSEESNTNLHPPKSNLEKLAKFNEPHLSNKQRKIAEQQRKEAELENLQPNAPKSGNKPKNNLSSFQLTNQISEPIDVSEVVRDLGCVGI